MGNTTGDNTPPANTPPANTPPANTPPANTPPANTPPANTPPEQPRPQVNVTGFSEVLSALNSLPEKLAEAVGEKFPVNPRVTQSADENANTPPANTNANANTPPANTPPPAAKQRTGSRFANWYFSGGKK